MAETSAVTLLALEGCSEGLEKRTKVPETTTTAGRRCPHKQLPAADTVWHKYQFRQMRQKKREHVSV